MRNRIKFLYLDYVNAFISVAYFAEYYEMSVEKANRIINIGRVLHHKQFK